MINRLAPMLFALLVGFPPLAARAQQATPTTIPTSTPQVVTATPTEEPTRTPTTTPGVTARPDRCERNEERTQACGLPLDAVSGPFTFLAQRGSAPDQDWYRIDLGAPTGQETTITVRAAAGLDLLTTISQDDGTPLTSFSSPTISTTLRASVAGGVILHVENRAPDDPLGRGYTIEVRRTLAPAPTAAPEAAGAATLTPDLAENNWNAETAAPLAVGVVYDLNLTCPVSWGCGGGDHDYFTVPVKANTAYLMATFDLGPGVDTVLDLFWGSPDTPILSADDYGQGMLSAITWTAPADGTVLLRVGPRNGGTQPLIAEGERGFYRLAIALPESELGKQVRERIQSQGMILTPTALSSPAPASGGSGGGAGAGADRPAPTVRSAPTARPAATPSGDAPTGPAVVLAGSTALRAAPDVAAETILVLEQEQVVTLLGQASGAFVRVQPQDGVIPGWVRGADLARLRDPQPTPSTDANPERTAPATDPVGSAPRPGAVGITPLPAAPLAAEDVPARVTVSFHVMVVQVPTTRTSRTVIPGTPLAGIRVQLVNAFGDVLTEAVTPADGQVMLNRDVPAGSALTLRLPAFGLSAPLDPAQPTISIQLPEASQ